MSKLLTRDQILTAQLKTRTLEVPELDGSVRIQEMNSAQLMGLKFGLQGRNGQLDTEKLKKLHAQTVINHVIDDNRQQIFSDEDMPALLQLSGGALKRIADAVGDLSGLADDDTLRKWLKERHPDILKAFEDSQNPVEVAKENFTKTRNGVSPSGSPSAVAG